MNDPKIILADEPTGALDFKSSELVMAMLQEIAKDRLVIFVSHNEDLIASYAQRVIEVKAARVIDLTPAMPNYHFVDPSQSIVKSIASTTDYVGMILLAFSLVALVISSLLFIIVMMVAVAENKGEAYLLYVLGISRSDIARSYAAECACYCGLALGVSLASMLLSEALIHGFHRPKDHPKILSDLSRRLLLAPRRRSAGSSSP